MWTRKKSVLKKLPKSMLQVHLDDEDMILGYVLMFLERSDVFYLIMVGDNVRIKVRIQLEVVGYMNSATMIQIKQCIT